MKVEKSERRELRRRKERLGMQVKGRSIKTLLPRIIAKKGKKA